VTSLTRLVPNPRRGRGSAAARRDRGAGHSDAARAVRLLARFTGGRHRAFVLSLGWLIIEAVTAVFEAYPLAYLIDYFKGDRGALALPGVASGRASTVAVLTMAVVAIAIVNSGAASLAQIHLARGGRALGFQLRVRLFSHLQRLSLTFHDRRRTGDVITRVTGDVKEIEKFVGDSLADLAGSVLLLAATLAFLVWQSWQVALVAALVVPVLACISSYFSSRIKSAARRQRAREGDLASTTQEMLTSIRVVQIFGRARHDQKRFSAESGKAMDAALEGARLDALFTLIVSILEALSIAAVIWIGLWLVDTGAITLGTLVLFTILVQRMFKPTRRIIKLWNTVARVYASVERIADLLGQEVTVRDEPGAVQAPPLRGQVDFKDVGFTYEPGPDGHRVGAKERRRGPALRDVSFTIYPGEVVALVGHSGAGKTTIAQLLPRLYDPQEGQVLLDGHDVRGFTLESLRSQISMVLQETVLLRGTVAENIAYGRTDATREQIVAAAERANAHEFIVQMPRGYDTDLNERASNLSGGQRQRIAIARAFIRDTPLLILDEPTTGLDAESTELVLGALRSLITEKTTLLISHSLHLIRRADRILVMRDGGIVETGTHESLLEEDGLYAELHASQFSDRERRPSHASRANGARDAPVDRVLEAATRPAAPPSSNGASSAAVSKRARSGNGHLPRAGFDPLRWPGLRRELPDLEVALDSDAMCERLQEALIGPDAPWVIERCSAGKALYLPDEGCKLRYELEIHGNGKVRQAIVGGRLFHEACARDTYLREHIERLAACTRRRGDLKPFAVPAAALDSLPMAVYAFPIDPELPTLIRASDPTEMMMVFRNTLPEALGESLVLDRCGVRPVRYARRRRCVLRYDVAGRVANSDRPAQLTLYGKVAADRPRRQADPALAALRERALDGTSGYRFRVPRLLAVRPELNLTVLERVPGAPRVGPLIKSRVLGPQTASAIGLEEAVDACAWIASSLHGWGIEVGARRTFEDDLNALRPDLEVVARMSPDLGAQLGEWTRQIVDRASTLAPLPAKFSHGDFTHDQVLFDDHAAGLLDFDGLCLAEPALDLGQFCAYLRLACAKAEHAAQTGRSGLGDELCDRFVRTYVEAAEMPHGEVRQLRDRIQVYEALRLVRVGGHSCQQLKATRLSTAVSVLEERIACMSTPVM
jgi:ABC-type multidrug transport system fused ATPase/permease subunit